MELQKNLPRSEQRRSLQAVDLSKGLAPLQALLTLPNAKLQTSDARLPKKKHSRRLCVCQMQCTMASFTSVFSVSCVNGGRRCRCDALFGATRASYSDGLRMQWSQTFTVISLLEFERPYIQPNIALKKLQTNTEKIADLRNLKILQ